MRREPYEWRHEYDDCRIDQRTPPPSGSYTYPNTASAITAYTLDTGIYRNHSDFGSRAFYGHNFINRLGDSDPKNLANNNDPAIADDCDGHGTHVAGIIGGTTAGVAKSVELGGVKVLDCLGSGALEEVLAGIDWVTTNAVQPDVVNMSLGGDEVMPALDAAVRQSIASGLTYTVAAGNGNAYGNGVNASALPGRLDHPAAVRACQPAVQHHRGVLATGGRPRELQVLRQRLVAIHRSFCVRLLG